MARSQLVDDRLWERSSRCWWIAPRSRQGAPSQRPDSVHGDRVCAGDWGTLANGPSADRLFWGGRLAAVAGVAARRGVGETAPRTSPPLERRWPDQLVAGVVDSSHIRALRGGPDRAFAG
jgi:hypothetical protein